MWYFFKSTSMFVSLSLSLSLFLCLILFDPFFKLTLFLSWTTDTHKERKSEEERIWVKQLSTLYPKKKRGRQKDDTWKSALTWIFFSTCTLCIYFFFFPLYFISLFPFLPKNPFSSLRISLDISDSTNDLSLVVSFNDNKHDTSIWTPLLICSQLLQLGATEYEEEGEREREREREKRVKKKVNRMLVFLVAPSCILVILHRARSKCKWKESSQLNWT